MVEGWGWSTWSFSFFCRLSWFSYLVRMRVVLPGWRKWQGFSRRRKFLGAILNGVVAGEPVWVGSSLEEARRFVISPVFHGRFAPVFGIAQHQRALLSWRMRNLQCRKLILFFVADETSPAARRRAVLLPRLRFGHSHHYGL